MHFIYYNCNYTVNSQFKVIICYNVVFYIQKEPFPICQYMYISNQDNELSRLSHVFTSVPNLISFKSTWAQKLKFVKRRCSVLMTTMLKVQPNRLTHLKTVLILFSFFCIILSKKVIHIQYIYILIPKKTISI